MKKSKAKDAKPQDDLFERVVGGDVCEFTVVCHPGEADAPAGKDIKVAPGPDLVCKLVEIKAQPAD
jgi:hypothetical protein